MVDFNRHMDEVNVDFKENIMKKVDVIKLKDTADLQLRVDEIKSEEYLAAEKLNKEYVKRELREQQVLDKTKKKKHLLMSIVANWETMRKKRALFGAWKQRLLSKKQEAEQGEYLHAFYL